MIPSTVRTGVRLQVIGVTCASRTTGFARNRTEKKEEAKHEKKRKKKRRQVNHDPGFSHGIRQIVLAAAALPRVARARRRLLRYRIQQPSAPPPQPASISLPALCTAHTRPRHARHQQYFAEHSSPTPLTFFYLFFFIFPRVLVVVVVTVSPFPPHRAPPQPQPWRLLHSAWRTCNSDTRALYHRTIRDDDPRPPFCGRPVTRSQRPPLFPLKLHTFVRTVIIW